MACGTPVVAVPRARAASRSPATRPSSWRRTSSPTGSARRSRSVTRLVAAGLERARAFSLARRPRERPLARLPRGARADEGLRGRRLARARARSSSARCPRCVPQVDETRRDREPRPGRCRSGSRRCPRARERPAAPARCERQPGHRRDVGRARPEREPRRHPRAGRRRRARRLRGRASAVRRSPGRRCVWPDGTLAAVATALPDRRRHARAPDAAAAAPCRRTKRSASTTSSTSGRPSPRTPTGCSVRSCSCGGRCSTSSAAGTRATGTTCEDIDLCYRAMRAGWERWYVPEAVVDARLRGGHRQALPLTAHALARARDGPLRAQAPRAAARAVSTRSDQYARQAGAGRERRVRRCPAVPRAPGGADRDARRRASSRATRCSTSRAATAGSASSCSRAGFATAVSTRRRRWSRRRSGGSATARRSRSATSTSTSRPSPVAATTVFRAIYYARDRRAFFARVAAFTEKKLVFDLNPRQYRPDDVVADLRAAGLRPSCCADPSSSRRRVALPRLVAAAAKTLERTGPPRAARAPVSLHLPRRGVAAVLAGARPQSASADSGRAKIPKGGRSAAAAPCLSHQAANCRRAAGTSRRALRLVDGGRSSPGRWRSGRTSARSPPRRATERSAR